MCYAHVVRVCALVVMLLATVATAQNPGDIIIRGNIDSEPELEALVGVDFAKRTSDTYVGAHDFSGAVVTFPANQNFFGIKLGNTICINAASNRPYHDADCNNSKGAGEEFLDFTSGTSLTIRTIDGVTTIPNVNEVRVTNGALTLVAPGIAQITTVTSGEPSPWADADPVVLDITTRRVRMGAAGVITAKVGITGDADEPQVAIRGNVTQSNPLLYIENSAGAPLMAVTNESDMRIRSIQHLDGPGTLWGIDSLGNVTGQTLNSNGIMTVKAANALRLNDADNSNHVGLKSPAVVGANQVWILPPTDGVAGQYLKTDGANQLGWATDQQGPGGGSGEQCESKNINNPETFTVLGTNGEFGPLFYFKNASTITRMRSYVLGTGTPSLVFTVYECTFGTNCTTPTLSSQGINGATLTTATTTGANDDTFSNATIAANNEVWIQVDKDNGGTVGPIILFFIAICYTTP